MRVVSCLGCNCTGNITPESIILNKNGEWRIAGVDFISHARYQDDSKYIYPETNVASSVIRSALPNLNYRAPEYELEGRGDITSDIYALGNIVYSLWNNGHPLCECQGNILTYNLNLEKISRMAAGDIPNIPNDLKELVKLMLNAHQSIRPTAEDFGRAPCFDNMQISCLRYLQNIYEKSDPNKAKFMKGLTSVLSSFPKRVLIKKVCVAVSLYCYVSGIVLCCQWHCIVLVIVGYSIASGIVLYCQCHLMNVHIYTCRF